MVTSLTKSEVTASAKSTLHLQARMETEANYYLKKKKKKRTTNYKYKQHSPRH